MERRLLVALGDLSLEKQLAVARFSKYLARVPSGAEALSFEEWSEIDWQ